MKNQIDGNNRITNMLRTENCSLKPTRVFDGYFYLLKWSQQQQQQIYKKKNAEIKERVRERERRKRKNEIFRH